MLDKDDVDSTGKLVNTVFTARIFSTYVNGDDYTLSKHTGVKIETKSKRVNCES